MRFAVTPTQQLLREAVAGVLGKQATSDSLRAAWESPGGRVPGLWQHLAELGVAGLVVPERHGGLGLDEVDLAGVLEETGRAAVPEPVVESYVAARVLDTAGATGPLEALAAGEQVVTVCLGGSPYAAYADTADLFLLQHGSEMHLVSRAAVTLLPQPSADPGRPLARVSWQPNPSTRLDVPPPVVASAFDQAAFGVAALLVGLAQGMLDQAVRHALQREQFGRLIGSFQAVKHALADVYVAVEFARPVVLRAAWSLARSLPSAPRDTSAAKYAAAGAAARAARAALQVHGAIGYTFEHDLHIWLKRTWSLLPAYGDADWHLARVAAATLDDDVARVP